MGSHLDLNIDGTNNDNDDDDDHDDDHDDDNPLFVNPDDEQRERYTNEDGEVIQYLGPV